MAASLDAWTDVHQERHALLCLLETLTPVQWDSPSLCSEWRVRDVVGHMVSESTMTIPKVLAGMFTSRFRIRRPLNVERAVPERRTVLVAADLWTSRFFPGHRLFSGLRVEATDADWSAGDGPVIRGPVEELILAMSGRPGGLDQLDGEGITSARDRAREMR